MPEILDFRTYPHVETCGIFRLTTKTIFKIGNKEAITHMLKQGAFFVDNNLLNLLYEPISKFINLRFKIENLIN